MQTTAVRIYGKEDLRLETFELPPLGDNEILAKVISDALCMSTFKAAEQGAAHKRVPDDVAQNPTIIGHEFCGVIMEVGTKWAGQFKKGQRFVIQPALGYKGGLEAPGYSYKYIGGDATYVVIPNEVMEMGCLLPYNGDAFFYGSLAEPMSCIAGAFHAQYHTKYGSYEHKMGVVKGGKMAILAGAGPMGLGAVDYILHARPRPSVLVVTDIDDGRLARAASLITPEMAEKQGVQLHYIKTKPQYDEVDIAEMYKHAPDGYDDVFVFAPVSSVVEMGDQLLGRDGCLNFFSGPVDTQFSAKFNFYNVHYASTHIVGTSGGNTDDMVECLDMMSSGVINPSVLISHVGGIDAVIETTLNLPKFRAGKMLIYPHINMPLTAISDFEALGKTDPLLAELDKIVGRHNGLWCAEAETYLLSTKGVDVF